MVLSEKYPSGSCFDMENCSWEMRLPAWLALSWGLVVFHSAARDRRAQNGKRFM